MQRSLRGPGAQSCVVHLPAWPRERPQEGGRRRARGCGCGMAVARHTAAVAACISPAWINKDLVGGGTSWEKHQPEWERSKGR